MRFTYEGKEYFLNFERDHRNVEVFRKRVKVQIRSLHPYTNAKLYLLGPNAGDRVIIASGTVGCLPTDPYSNAQGRLEALRTLSYFLRKMKMDRGLIQAMWQTYMKRGDTPELKSSAPVTHPSAAPGTALVLASTAQPTVH